VTAHSAKTLFDTNIESATDCVTLYEGLTALKTPLQIDWVLRAAIVFSVSALDSYFHDKVKYRVGKLSLENLPPALAKFQISIEDLTNWDTAQRKGNVLRNWVTEYLSTRPLQSPTAIADAMKLAGYIALWDTIEPNNANKKQLLLTLGQLVKRRNQIAHEGDREQSRKSGKQLRKIKKSEVDDAIQFVKDVVTKIEHAFPG